MDEKIQLEAGLELWKVDLDDLIEQDINARSMSDAMFLRLSETIKKGSRLEALPFCALTDRGIEVVSGHHRARAARDAGMKDVFIIIDTTGLTPSEIKAKQLAHNAISGFNDPAMVKQIFEQLQTVDDIRESFTFEGDFSGLDKVGESGSGIGEVQVDLTLHAVHLLFLTSVYDKWQELAKAVPPATEQVAIADREMEDKFKVALKATGKSYDIKAVTPMVSKMMDAVIGTAVEEDGWKYLTDIFGPRVPPEAAEVMEKAIEKALESKDITKKNIWQIIEYWAADYLGGK